MPSSTLDRPTPGDLPAGHSFEDHLAAERAALEAERRALAGQAASRRWRLLCAAGVGLVVAGALGIGWQRTRSADDAVPARCPASAPAEPCAPDAAGR